MALVLNLGTSGVGNPKKHLAYSVEAKWNDIFDDDDEALTGERILPTLLLVLWKRLVLDGEREARERKRARGRLRMEEDIAMKKYQSLG